MVKNSYGDVESRSGYFLQIH